MFFMRFYSPQLLFLPIMTVPTSVSLYHGLRLGVNRVQVGVMLVLPLVLLLLPANGLDNGPVKCLSVLLAGQECYACGLTRASMRLIHLDVAGAASFNKLVFLVLPILVLFYAQEILRCLKHDPATSPWLHAQMPWLMQWVGRFK